MPADVAFGFEAQAETDHEVRREAPVVIGEEIAVNAVDRGSQIACREAELAGAVSGGLNLGHRHSVPQPLQSFLVIPDRVEGKRAVETSVRGLTAGKVKQRSAELNRVMTEGQGRIVLSSIVSLVSIERAGVVAASGECAEDIDRWREVLRCLRVVEVEILEEGLIDKARA